MKLLLNKIILLGLIPYLAVYIGLSIFQSAILAMTLYQFFMLFVLMLMRINNRDIASAKFREDNHGKPYVPVLFCVLFLSGPLLYLYLVVSPHVLVRTMGEIPLLSFFQRFGLIETTSKQHTLGIFLLYFAVVHPIVEQNFWRSLFSYVQKTSINAVVLHLCFVGYHLWVLSYLMSVQFLLGIGIILTLVSLSWNLLAEKGVRIRTLVYSHILTDSSMALAIWLFLFWRK